MTVDDVFEALKAAVESVAPVDGSHRAGFYLADDPSVGLGSRAFQLELALPPGPAMEYADGFGSSADPMVAEWSLSVVWHAQDRKIYGAESVEIVRALNRLPGGHAEIREIAITPQDVIGSADAGETSEQFRALVWRLSVQFDTRTPP